MKKSIASLILAGTVFSSVVFANSCKKENLEGKSSSPDYYSHFIMYEGKRNEVYDPNPRDAKDEPTIGVGHYLDNPSSRESFQNALLGVDYDSVYSGKRKLTEEEIKKLFDYDLSMHIEKTRKAFREFDSYPDYLKIALVDGFYRGDLEKSPKTRALINEGKFHEASIEYLNHQEYRNSKKKKMRGIFYRMNENSRAMRRYSRERGRDLSTKK